MSQRQTTISLPHLLSRAIAIASKVITAFGRLLVFAVSSAISALAGFVTENRPESSPAPDNVSPMMETSSSTSAPEPAPLVREGDLVRLRRHSPANRAHFQRWYADPEIANLLRHDLRPLNDRQSRGYFDSVILPLSASGHSFAIHDLATDELIGTTALTETDDNAPAAMLFRIVIGEKDYWDRGYGSDATRLVVQEAFETLGLAEVRLEVFAHNPRAISVYERAGFVRTGEHTEWLGPDRPRLHVLEMSKCRTDPDIANRTTDDERVRSDSIDIDAIRDFV